VSSVDHIHDSTPHARFLEHADGLVQNAISHREHYEVLKYRDVWHIRRVPTSGPRKGTDRQNTPPRGEITSFSHRSRYRLLVAMAEARAVPTHFITLTYPRVWPVSPRDWKRHLDSLVKRLLRRWPNAGVLWRLEFQKRGAPHFHAQLYGIDGVSPLEFRLWLRQAWYDVVGSGDERHLYAGTQADEVRSHAHAARYVAKYAAKVDSGEYAPDTGGEPIGRFWGVRGTLDRTVEVVVTISRENLVELRRTIRSWLRSRGARRYAKRLARMPLEYSFSVLGLGPPSLGGLTA